MTWTIGIRKGLAGGDAWMYAWALGSVALGGASLLVPLYVVALGGSPFFLGLLAAVAAFGGAPAALTVGRFVDRGGAGRPVVVVALSLVAVTLLLLPAVRSLPVVVAANAVIWVAFAAVAPVLTLFAVVGTAESDWPGRLARLNLFQGVGWAGGLVLGAVWTPVVGGVLGPIGAQRTFFLACAVCSGSAAVVSVRVLPGITDEERPSERALSRAVRRARRVNIRGATFPFTPGRLYWTTRRLRPKLVVERFTLGLAIYFLAVAFAFTGFAAFFAPLPLFLRDVGFADGTVFALYLVSSIGSAAAYTAAGRLTERYDVTLVQAGGLVSRGIAIPAVGLVGAVLAATTAGLASTGAVFLAIGVTWAFIAVSAGTLVTRLAPVALRGEALGVYAALSAVAGGIGSVLGGALASRSYLLAFGVAGGLILAAAGLVFLIRRVAPARAPAVRLHKSEG